MTKNPIMSERTNQNWKLFSVKISRQNSFHLQNVFRNLRQFQNSRFLSENESFWKPASAGSQKSSPTLSSMLEFHMETERVCVQSARSAVFEVGRVVPTCPAPHCQEITTPSPWSPADCWEKRSLFDVLKRDLRCNWAFHLIASLFSLIHPDIFTGQKLHIIMLHQEKQILWRNTTINRLNPMLL